MSNELLTTTQHWGGVPPIPESAVLQPEFLTDPQSGSLLDYWRAVRRSKKAVAVCSMTGLLLGIGVAFLQPTYRWRAQSVPSLNRVALLSGDTTRSLVPPLLARDHAAQPATAAETPRRSTGP